MGRTRGEQQRARTRPLRRLALLLHAYCASLALVAAMATKGHFRREPVCRGLRMAGCYERVPLAIGAVLVDTTATRRVVMISSRSARCGRLSAIESAASEDLAAPCGSLAGGAAGCCIVRTCL